MDGTPGVHRLEVEDFTVGYGAAPIVKNVSLAVQAGTVTSIIGPNGAGKSTLAKAVVGLIKPMGGRLKVDGVDLSGRTPEQLARSGIGYVPQVMNVFPSLTVRENLEMGCFLRRSKTRHRLDAVFTMFPDLRSAAKRDAWTLSGGQRSMLAIGRALMPEPNVLVLDEPTAGLAPRFQTSVWEHVRTVAGLGLAVLAIEQNARLALSNSEQACVLVLGEVRRRGPGEELLADPELVSLYIGGGDGGRSLHAERTA